MELKKIHEDERRSIHLVSGLLPEEREFTFIDLHKGKAIGGCYHTEDEYYAIIKGKVKVIIGEEEKEAVAGDSGTFPKGVSHGFIAIEDSIVSEWGIKTSEKECDVKDIAMRERLDEINSKS